MTQANTKRRTGRREDGYALLLVLFLLAVLALGTLAALPNALTDGRREKEEEMIWRGKQYVRGIRLYYQKTHKFPAELEDLYKPKTGIRFMRQAFKDPMNSSDGSWRLIYVGPNGQLIGSLKNRTVTSGGQAAQGFGNSIAFGGSNQSSFGSSSFGNSSFGSSSFNNSSFGSNSSFGANPGTNGAAVGSSQNAQSPQNPQNPQDSNDPNAQNSGTPGDLSTPQSLTPSDTGSTPTVIGGNIIGVGSKINKKSFVWYEKAKNYRQFEFVWDPSVDSVTGQTIVAPPPNPNASGLGTTPNSTTPNSPFSTGTPNTNPGQNPSSNPGANSPPGIPPLQAPPQ